MILKKAVYPLQVKEVGDNGILRTVMLRRTKDTKDKEGRLILVLPPTDIQLIECEQSESERDFYDALFLRSKGGEEADCDEDMEEACDDHEDVEEVCAEDVEEDVEEEQGEDQ
ncbi:DNA repair protein rad8-like isoform X2 [Vicia villosa]|nr:DNA repair protein rad8-like isoform X2 [Vicia villosa]XP_058729135.1 DNA repair protein rad8-like isoform X2 [Vicia villosa]